MTDSENEIFEQIANADENADLAAVEAPEADTRKDGIYYHATREFIGGDVVYYQVVIDHRVVAMVRVAEDVEAPLVGRMQELEGVLVAGAKVHPITLTKPDGTGLLATAGVTMKAPHGILNRTMIKAYVMPRLAKLLVRLYGIGA
jgi:hypothetical protein